MRRRMFTVGGCLGAGLFGLKALAASLSEFETVAGVRALLKRGASSAVTRLGKPGGFLRNRKVRIRLPNALKDAVRRLDVSERQRLVGDLEVAMNSAAESAVRNAKWILIGTVNATAVHDARRVVSRGGDAATRLFEGRTRKSLEIRLLPLVTRAGDRLSLGRKYDRIVDAASDASSYRARGETLQKYVTSKALDGLYFMMGEEERKIRLNPIATRSAILRKVFGFRGAR